MRATTLLLVYHNYHFSDRLLVDVGFVEVTSYPLGIDKAEEMLLQLGIPQPQPELIVLGQNLLSLELIGAIKQQQKDFDFSTVLDEVDLWEEYLTALERGELTAMFPTADTFIAVAHRLALAGLKSPDRTVSLGAFPSREEQRLVSCKLLLPERGRSYRFRHDQLQEYLYARDAAEQALMPSAVIEEIGPYRARRVLPWIDKVYERQNSSVQAEFLEVLFNV